MPDQPVSQLFIVGLPRAGTSTLVHALRSIGFHGFAEGHLLELVCIIENTITRYYETWKGANVPDTMINRVNMPALMLRYRELFRDMFEKSIGARPWLD